MWLQILNLLNEKAFQSGRFFITKNFKFILRQIILSKVLIARCQYLIVLKLTIKS